MSPEVTAAIIAGSVGMVTLIATVIVQIVGFRSTKANTEQQIKATHKDTADTLGHQREQLDITLAQQRIRTLNERFATAAEQLGSEKPAVRLAGVYAMGGLAEDWRENRQTCVDVLCAYLRMPYEPDPGQDAPESQRLAFRADREVRHTVIRVIATHLQEDAAASWRGLNFDFTGVVFDGGDFSGAEFLGSTVDFQSAQFSSGTVSFRGARFSRGDVEFRSAQFSGSIVDFGGAQFSGGTVSFVGAQFSGGQVVFNGAQFSRNRVYFSDAHFSGSTVDFMGAQFLGGEVFFIDARFSIGTVNFNFAKFLGSIVDFGGAEFSGCAVAFDWSELFDGAVDFRRTKFSRGTVNFCSARFSGGTVPFAGAEFSGGTVDFNHARFTGSTVNFKDVKFTGGTVDFSDAGDWSVPPLFPWKDTPPSGVKLPQADFDGATSLLPSVGWLGA
jgi:uncharacterized protein YjbI with pentapeptide repeats